MHIHSAGVRGRDVILYVFTAMYLLFTGVALTRDTGYIVCQHALVAANARGGAVRWHVAVED